MTVWAILLINHNHSTITLLCTSITRHYAYMQAAVCWLVEAAFQEEEHWLVDREEVVVPSSALVTVLHRLAGHQKTTDVVGRHVTADSVLPGGVLAYKHRQNTAYTQSMRSCRVKTLKLMIWIIQMPRPNLSLHCRRDLKDSKLFKKGPEIAKVLDNRLG